MVAAKDKQVTNPKNLDDGCVTRNICRYQEREACVGIVRVRDGFLHLGHGFLRHDSAITPGQHKAERQVQTDEGMRPPKLHPVAGASLGLNRIYAGVNFGQFLAEAMDVNIYVGQHQIED